MPTKNNRRLWCEISFFLCFVFIHDQKNDDFSNTQKFSGVYYEINTKKYRCEIELGDENRHIVGYFDDPITGMFVLLKQVFFGS